MTLVVQKYGGTSVGSLDHIRNVAKHVAATVAKGHHVLVTISAMGEQTDDLLTMAHQLNARPPRRELDMLLTAGERISAALLAIALAERNVPAVSLTGSQCGILTDETHGNARITRILGDRIRDNLASGKVVIVAGFQGVSPRTREITTLGRGGSDLSAIALAVALGAEHCELSKDVRGVYTCDPRLVPAARVLRELSFAAMTALAWGGASVLHPRGAHLASKYAVPFEIRSSMELDQRGTIIRGSHDVETPKIEAMSHRSGLSLIECRVGGRQTAPLVAEALDWLWQQGESPVVSTQSIDQAGGVALSQVIKSSLAGDYLAQLGQAVERGGGTLELTRQVEDLASISIVGQGFQQSPETVRKVCDVLGVMPAVLQVSNTVLTVCLAGAQLKPAINALHQALIEVSPVA